MLGLAANEWWLVVASFFTSAFTAVFGVGGGVLLLSFMPGLIPAAAIIPVHGFVQLFSNSTRVMFAWRSVRYELIWPYLAGGIFAAWLGTRVILSINAQYIPAIVGVFILITVWMPKKIFSYMSGHYCSFGFISTFISSVAGVSGPMVGAFLSRENLGRDSLVTTIASFMTVSHILKLLAFGLMGFAFADYLTLMLLMSVSVAMGSFAGTHIRKYLPDLSFKKMFRWLITALALKMIYSVESPNYSNAFLTWICTCVG